MRKIEAILTIDPKLPRFKKKDFQDLWKKVRFLHRSKKNRVEVHLTDSSVIKKLNWQFRRKNKATDVLSFPSSQEDLLGSIVIDIKTAEKQAQEYRHSLKREVLELYIHGLLHLLGFDHERSKDAQLMKQKEEFILQNFLDRIEKSNRRL